MTREVTPEELNRTINEARDPYGMRISPLDYCGSEEAGAALLEQMRRPLLVSDWPGCEGWRVDLGVAEYMGKPIGPTHADRKVAVAMAWLAWKERRKK